MAVNVSYYATSIAHTGIGTLNTTAGGPLEVRYEHVGEALLDRTGDNEYAPFLAVVNKHLRVTIRAREMKNTVALGSKDDVVCSLKTKSTPITLTLKDMVVVSVTGDQGRAVAGGVEYVLEHESSNGTTVPVT